MCFNFKPRLIISFFCAVTGSLAIGVNISVLNLLENFINCWYLHLDKKSGNYTETYQTTCQNATELSKNGEFETYAFRWSAVSSAALFGGTLAIVFVPIIDRYGRLTAVRFSIILALTGVGLQAIAFYINSYIALLVGRLVFGFQLGIGVMVYPVYFVEIAPETCKSVFGMCFGMFVNFGILMSMDIYSK